MPENQIQLETGLNLDGIISQLQAARTEASTFRDEMVTAARRIKESYDSMGGAIGGVAPKLAENKQKIIDTTVIIQKLSTELDSFKKTGTTAFDSTKITEYQAKVDSLLAELDALKSGAKGIGTDMGNDLSKGGAGASALTVKLNEAREAQKLLKQEVKDFNTAINSNDKAIAAANKELSSITASTANYRARTTELKTELQGLYQKNETLVAGLASTEKEYAANAVNIKAYTKELTVAEKEAAAAAKQTGGFGKTMEDSTSKGNVFVKGLSAIFSSLRQVAYILPGVGLAGLISFLAEPITNAVINGWLKLKEAVMGLSDAEKHYQLIRSTTKEINDETIKGYVKQTTQLELLKGIITDSSKSMVERNAALAEYNSVADAANKIDASQINNINLVNDKINIQIGLIKQRALARASENIVSKRAEDLLLAEETAREKFYEAQRTSAAAFKNERIVDVIDYPAELESLDKNGKAILIKDKDIIKQRIDAGRDNANKLRQQRLQDNFVDNDDAVKAAKEKLDVATKAANGLIDLEGFAGKKINEKHRAYHQKDIDDTKEFSAMIVSLEKQLADARIALMEEGRKKDVAIEEARYNAAINSLELMRENADRKLSQDKNVTPKELQEYNQVIDLVNKNEEAQQEEHNKKLLTIDTKYYSDVLKALTAANEAIQSALATGQDREINSVTKKYETIVKNINDSFAKLQGGDVDPRTLAESTFAAMVLVKKATEEQAKEINDIKNKYETEGLKNTEDINLKAIDAMKANGLTEEELTKLKEATKLKITKAAAQQQLDLLIKQQGLESQLTDNILKKLGDPKALQQATAQKQDIFDYLGIIFDEKDPEKLDAIKKRFLELRTIIDKPAPKKGLLETLGLSPEDVSKFDAFNKGIGELGGAFSDMFSAFEQGVDQQIAAKEKLIQSLQQAVDAQQSAVDKEKALADKGYANNYKLEQKRLADLKKQQADELKLQQDLQRKKQALQKEELIAQSIQQASNLITASTNIYDELSPLGPVGIGIAVATIAAMITGFVAAKAAAFKAVGSGTTLEKGGKAPLQKALRGASSHREGGVDVIDNKTGKKLYEFEGDEDLFVINKGSTKKHAELLEAINKDDFSKLGVDKWRGLVQFMPLEINKEKHPLLQQKQSSAIIHTSVNSLSSPHLEKMAKGIEIIAATNKDLLDIEKNREVVTEYDDRIEYKRGNYTRIAKKPN